MHKTTIFHINDDDQVVAQREDDKLWITVLSPAPPEGDRAADGSWHRYNTGTALEIFVDPIHFAALRQAMDMVDARERSKMPEDL